MIKYIWIDNIKNYPDFYIEMFGNRQITNALGVSIHCTDCDEWLLAVDNDVILGFSGYEIHGKVFILKRSFVFPKYRRFGIYKEMLDLRIEKANHTSCNVFQATTTMMSREEFEKRGFKCIKAFKKYQTYRKLI